MAPGTPTQRRSDPWLGVELRHLAALSAIAETGSFRAAARKLGYVQSAVSQQVSRLEEIVGVRLIERERGTGPVRLTAVGNALLSHADGVLAQMGAARADLARAAGEGGGTALVGATHDVAARVAPRVLAGLVAPLAEGALRLVERGDDRSLLGLLASGAVDVAFVELPLPEGPFAHVELAASPWLLFAARSASPPPLTLDDLARLPLIAPRASRAFAVVEARLQRDPGTPRIVFRADMWDTVRGLAVAGVGSAIVPGLLAPEHAVEQAIDLGDLLPAYDLALAWHRERRLGELADRFVEVARRELSGRRGT